MVLEAHGERLVIAAAEGGVAPRTIQLAGKRAMGIAELLRGHPIQPGEWFGPEA
jgi:methionyl-tRNA formyltransferase